MCIFIQVEVVKKSTIYWIFKHRNLCFFVSFHPQIRQFTVN